MTTTHATSGYGHEREIIEHSIACRSIFLLGFIIQFVKFLLEYKILVEDKKFRRHKVLNNLPRIVWT